MLPLSEPVRTASGELVNTLKVAKGTLVSVPLASINLATAVWGEDAKVFRPSHWFDNDSGQNGIPAKAKELQGHRHLLTFSDGPRICLGKNFAVAELKVGTDGVWVFKGMLRLDRLCFLYLLNTSSLSCVMARRPRSRWGGEFSRDHASWARWGTRCPSV